MLPRLNESISFAQDRGRFVLEEDSVGDQACFFSLDETGSEGADEALSDLLYYL